MRVLCVCKSGNVRSVTLARLLRKRGAEVLSCGVDKSYTTYTLRILTGWANVIYCQKDAQARLWELLTGDIPQDQLDHNPEVSNYYKSLREKISTQFDVGPDDWKIPDHPDLLARMRRLVLDDPEWGESTKQ